MRVLTRSGSSMFSVWPDFAKDGEAGRRDHPLQPHARLQAAVVLVAGENEHRGRDRR